MQSPAITSSGRWWVTASLAVLTGWIWVGVGSPSEVRELAAQQIAEYDADFDGVPDRQELVLGTDPLAPDSDLDGFTDGEELAMQTSPLEHGEVPESGGSLSLGMSARGEGGQILIFIAVHRPAKVKKETTMRVGMLLGRKLVNLTMAELTSMSKVTALSVPNGGSLVTYDFTVPAGLLTADRPLTLFGALGKEGKTRYIAAAKVDISRRMGVPMLRRKVAGPGGPGTAQPSGDISIHQPIPPKGEGGVPIDWEAGKVCYQTSAVTGTSGALVIHEIVSAHCDEALDTYCESDCPGTVGSSFQTIDTGVLLGG